YHRIASFKIDDLVDLFLRLRDGAAHIPAANREFYGGIAPVLVAEDETRAGLLRNAGDLADRHLGTAGRGYEQVAYIFPGSAVLFGKPDADIEFADTLVQLGHGLAADGHLDHSIGIGRADAIEGHLTLIEIDIQFRLSDIFDHSEVFDAFHVFQDIVYFHRLLFHVIERVSIDLYANGTFYAGNRLFDIIHDGLREIEIGSRDNRQRLAHRIDQLFLGDLRVPVFLRVEGYTEFVVIETGHIGAVVGPAGLGHDTRYLRETHHDALHLFALSHGSIE